MALTELLSQVRSSGESLEKFREPYGLVVKSVSFLAQLKFDIRTSGGSYDQQKQTWPGLHGHEFVQQSPAY